MYVIKLDWLHKDSDFKCTFSPTLRRMSFHMLLQLATFINLEIHHLDVQTTFLHGELDEEVYIYQPPFFESAQFPTHICWLQKSPQVWYYHLHSSLLNNSYVGLRNEILKI